ncbi:hypothetical protein PMAYCL1PPCAC_10548, partial [Pristionchus mayeri]
MPTLTSVMFPIAGFVSWLIALYSFAPLVKSVAVALSASSRLQTTFAIVAGPYVAWALDSQFTHWICAVKATFLDDPYTPPSARSQHLPLFLLGSRSARRDHRGKEAQGAEEKNRCCRVSVKGYSSAHRELAGQRNAHRSSARSVRGYHAA